jgi:hypothetical protein
VIRTTTLVRRERRNTADTLDIFAALGDNSASVSGV